MRNRVPDARRGLPLAAMGLCLAASGALAADPEPAQAPAATASAATTATAAAPAPAPHDHPIALRDEAALPIIEHADGSRSVVLDASFLSTSVARIGPDGKVIIGCVQSREEYDAFFAAEALPDGAEVR